MPPKAGVFVPATSSVFAFAWSIATIVLVYLMTRRAKQGKKIPEIRKIQGIDAFSEAVGRAAETGRPVHITDFNASIGDDGTFAYWSFLAYIARMSASYDTRLIVTDSNYMVNVVNREIVRQSYLEMGKPGAFDPDDVRYIAEAQFAWAIGVAGLVARERPAAQFLIGYFFAESLLIAEAGNLVGAIQVAASNSSGQIPFFVAACDYTMIGEEMYAAAAYVSKDPVITGSVVAQDLMRLLLYAIILFGGVLDVFMPETNFVRTMLKF